MATAISSNSGTHLRDATLVHKLFEGVLTSETRCLTCETVSFHDVPLFPGTKVSVGFFPG